MTDMAVPTHLALAVDRNGELHDTRDIEVAPGALAAPLRCADCGAPLEAVRAPRRDRDAIVHVAAQYRLAPGAAHTTTCPWRSQQELAGPAARPAHRPPAAPLVYSLVVPGRGDMLTPVWRSRSFRQTRRPPLNSASKVADLLARQGDNGGRIRLDYRGRPINWHDFLFTCADVERLSQLLQQGRPGHPVAIVGRLGDRVAAYSGRTYFAVLSDPFAPPTLLPGGARIVVRASNGQLLDSDHEARLVVVIGWWRLHSQTSPAHVPHVHDDVVLWVNRGWQISACRQ